MCKDFEKKPEYRKGRIGEEIVRRWLEQAGYSVNPPDDVAPSGASVVDFVVEGKYERFFVEVKVKSPFAYCYGRYPVYTFAASQIDTYEAYRAEHDTPVALYIVDEERKVLCAQYLTNLAQPKRVEDKFFPLDIEQVNGLYRYYHISQFTVLCELDDDDLARLAAIKISGEKGKRERDEETESPSPLDDTACVEKMLKTPHGVEIDILSFKGGYYVKLTRLSTALGFKGGMKEGGALLLALEKAGIEILDIACTDIDGRSRRAATKCVPLFTVPRLLDTFANMTADAGARTKKRKRNEQARELFIWFSQVANGYYGGHTLYEGKIMAEPAREKAKAVVAPATEKATAVPLVSLEAATPPDVIDEASGFTMRDLSKLLEKTKNRKEPVLLDSPPPDVIDIPAQGVTAMVNTNSGEVFTDNGVYFTGQGKVLDAVTTALEVPEEPVDSKLKSVDVVTTSLDSPEMPVEETLIGLVGRIALKLELPATLIGKALRELKMEHDPALKELMAI